MIDNRAYMPGENLTRECDVFTLASEQENRNIAGDFRKYNVCAMT